MSSDQAVKRTCPKVIPALGGGGGEFKNTRRLPGATQTLENKMRHYTSGQTYDRQARAQRESVYFTLLLLAFFSAGCAIAACAGVSL